jgi:hypothetical protein
MGTAEKLIERRLDRMRLGQAVCEIEELLSETDFRVALVPLTEAEYDRCIENVLKVDAPETMMGNQVRDRALTNETLLLSIREPDNLSQQMFSDLGQMTEALDVVDINYLIDVYFEMIEKSSPAAEGMTGEQINDLKKVLLEMDMSELSGKQWYALKRFLSSLGPTPLLASLLGFSSTSQLTGTSELPESIEESANGN